MYDGYVVVVVAKENFEKREIPLSASVRSFA